MLQKAKHVCVCVRDSSAGTVVRAGGDPLPVCYVLAQAANLRHDKRTVIGKERKNAHFSMLPE